MEAKDMIARLRAKKGMTQEELAGGVLVAGPPAADLPVLRDAAGGYVHQPGARRQLQ